MISNNIEFCDEPVLIRKKIPHNAVKFEACEEKRSMYCITIIKHDGINKVDCIESLMIAYELKINIFEEMRYFLMFYLNLDFILCWALVLLILSNFIFQSDIVFPELLFSFYATFLKDCITCFSELHMQSFCVIDLYRTAYEVCMNFKQSRHICLPKKKNECSGKTILIKRKLLDKSWIKPRVLMPSAL